MKPSKRKYSSKKSRGRPPSKASMEALLREAGLKVTPKKLGLLWKFHQLIRKYDDQWDLTRIKNFEAMVVKHYIDCLYIRRLVKLPSPLLDIGTGPGFPGIPLKIFTPSLEIVLAEKRQKRVEFLRLALAELGLDGQVYPHGVGPSFPLEVRGVITRALERIEKTLNRVLPFLPRGGRVFFMKGPNFREEAEASRKEFSGIFQLVHSFEYQLPHSPHDRALLVFERTAPLEQQQSEES